MAANRATSATQTNTSTHTISVSAADVREIVRFITADILAVCGAAPNAAREFESVHLMIEVPVLVMTGVAKAVNLELYKDGTVIRTYTFLLSDEPGGTTGRPAGQPPLGYVPPGAHIRLSIEQDMRLSDEERLRVLKELRWVKANPLIYPKDAAQSSFGSYHSGGLCVERYLLTNPRFDRAAS